jgi:hypothetical protein
MRLNTLFSVVFRRNRFASTKKDLSLLDFIKKPAGLSGAAIVQELVPPFLS